jgi:hypothetical protein
VIQLPKERRQLQQPFNIKLRARGILGCGFCTISPFTCHGVAAAFRVAQDECLDAGYAPDFKDLAALASIRMEWMDDFRPSQR